MSVLLVIAAVIAATELLSWLVDSLEWGGETLPPPNINDILHMEISSLIELEDFKFLSNIYQFMEALGLDHLTLGRSVSSLSGGEAQRLKLVEFLLSTNNVKFIILDEPCRGLDKKSISKTSRHST